MLKDVPEKYRHTYTPRACQPYKNEAGLEVMPEYKGTLTLKIPSYDERIELSGLGQVELVEGEGDVEEQVRAQLQKRAGMQRLRMLAQRLDDFVLAVDLTRTEDGCRFETLEDLRHEGDLGGVVTEAALKLVEKFKVGNSHSTT